jgi:small GTP-binding protein
VVSGSGDKTVRIWEVASGRCEAVLQGHTDEVLSVSWSGDGRRVASGSGDKTVRVWDIASGRCEAVLQGHTERVWSVSWSGDGRRVHSAAVNGVAIDWDFAPSDNPPAQTRSRYTNAKVLLVGDSGVGKTGLAYRLSGNEFRESVSTDGAFATHLPIPHAKSTKDIEREIWLWDFAGQADYRLIHQLFMDETALAVLVFNPQSENPFEGLGQWERDLQRAARGKFKTLLVAGRCDRGGLMVSRQSLEQFRKDRGFADYIETSASQGMGCDELRKAIVRHIDWKEIPWESSPRSFKRLKDDILKLRDEGRILLRIAELKQQLDLRLPGEAFQPDELRAVVGLLAGPGVVWKLEFGDFVLLQPERINAYAAAVIRKVRAHTEEIGCIFEEEVLAGELDYQDMNRLSPDEEPIVLRAMHQTLVDHGLYLREHTEKGTLLIFPSYFKRERPDLEKYPLVLVTYKFSGPLDEIYATLVVRLHHTEAFEKKQLWRFAADFQTLAGKSLGLKLNKKAEGAGELEVYFEPGISNETQVSFIRYVHEHLMRKAQDVVRLRHFVCDHCGTAVENRRAIDLRLEKGFRDIVCSVCEERVPLWDLIEERFASPEFIERVRLMEEQARAVIDNESRELIVVGHAYAIAGETGQIYRQYASSDHGIDGEIEFKDQEGKASGKRLYLQLKSGDSYLTTRKRDDAEVFMIKNDRWASYWRQQAHPVMLVIRTSGGAIRWMEVTQYLKRESQGGKKPVTQVVFDGEPFTALSLLNYRKKALARI